MYHTISHALTGELKNLMHGARRRQNRDMFLWESFFYYIKTCTHQTHQNMNDIYFFWIRRVQRHYTSHLLSFLAVHMYRSAGFHPNATQAALLSILPRLRTVLQIQHTSTHMLQHENAVENEIPFIVIRYQLQMRLRRYKTTSKMSTIEVATGIVQYMAFCTVPSEHVRLRAKASVRNFICVCVTAPGAFQVKNSKHSSRVILSR